MTSVAGETAILIEIAITPIFLFDFAYRLLTAPSRHRYMFRRWGWADLVAVVPLLRLFRIFRMVAVAKEARVVGRERLLEDIWVSRASTTFLFTIFLVIAVVEFAGMAEYYVEQGVPNANITTAGDSIWWGLVTITTVGYGDQYPVGEGGRLVGVLLLFAGIGLFSVLTGFIANVFLAPDLPRRRARIAPGTPAAELAALARAPATTGEAAGGASRPSSTTSSGACSSGRVRRRPGTLRASPPDERPSGSAGRRSSRRC